MTQQEQNKTVNDWLQAEEERIATQGETVFEKLPAMKFEENKLIEITILYDQPFASYETTDMKGGKVVKAIIPILHNNEKKNLWLNKRNPLYKDIIKLGKDNPAKLAIIKVMQTGQKQNTKYILVK